MDKRRIAIFLAGLGFTMNPACSPASVSAQSGSWSVTPKFQKFNPVEDAGLVSRCLVIYSRVSGNLESKPPKSDWKEYANEADRGQKLIEKYVSMSSEGIGKDAFSSMIFSNVLLKSGRIPQTIFKQLYEQAKVCDQQILNWQYFGTDAVAKPGLSAE